MAGGRRDEEQQHLPNLFFHRFFFQFSIFSKQILSTLASSRHQGLIWYLAFLVDSLHDNSLSMGTFNHSSATLSHRFEQVLLKTFKRHLRNTTVAITKKECTEVEVIHTFTNVAESLCRYSWGAIIIAGIVQ